MLFLKKNKIDKTLGDLPLPTRTQADTIRHDVSKWYGVPKDTNPCIDFLVHPEDSTTKTGTTYRYYVHARGLPIHCRYPVFRNRNKPVSNTKNSRFRLTQHESNCGRHKLSIIYREVSGSNQTIRYQLFSADPSTI